MSKKQKPPTVKVTARKHGARTIPVTKEFRENFARQLYKLRVEAVVSEAEKAARAKMKRGVPPEHPLTLRELGDRCRALRRSKLGFQKCLLSLYETGARMPGLGIISILTRALGRAKINDLLQMPECPRPTKRKKP